MPSYLTAGKIKEGMSGTISGELYIDQKDFKDGEGVKDIAQLPITLDVGILDYNGKDEKEWIWAPGFNAQKLLQEQLGDEMQGWINTHGSFHPKAWASKTRNGLAWHFIPDNSNPELKPYGIPKPEPEKAAVPIECAYCAEAGDFWSTSKPENMLAHIEKFHPEKVKDELKAVKARVKKE